ncbi:hypothetical protein KIPB_011118, partial [Kipferlia bialata]|eukprot:g11118.t1
MSKPKPGYPEDKMPYPTVEVDIPRDRCHFCGEGGKLTSCQGFCRRAFCTKCLVEADATFTPTPEGEIAPKYHCPECEENKG